MAENLTDTQKYDYIKQKYGEKAEVMLQTYGTKAYDIDKNFSKFYNDKVFFGRNYWMSPKESQERSAEGVKNKKLFEEGKLPLKEAAKIINCPSYFGSLNSTVERISGEIKQSAAVYKDTHKIVPQSQETKPAQKEVQQKQPEKVKTAEKPAMKKELRAQRKVADLKPVMLEEVVITAKAPQQIKLAAKLDVKVAEKPDISKIDIKVKSPAERKYDELIAQKAAKMPDDMAGRKGAEIGLTIGELMELGVDPKGDFQTILKNMGEKDRASAEKLIPESGFKDEKVVVSKELAIAAIERAQVRELSKKRGKVRA